MLHRLLLMGLHEKVALILFHTKKTNKQTNNISQKGIGLKLLSYIKWELFFSIKSHRRELIWTAYLVNAKLEITGISKVIFFVSIWAYLLIHVLKMGSWNKWIPAYSDFKYHLLLYIKWYLYKRNNWYLKINQTILLAYNIICL